VKRVLIVGAGKWQVPLIQTAKSQGYFVATTNLFANSPGFEISDQFAEIDVRDKEKTLEFAKKLKVDAVISDQSDLAVPTVAYVAEKLGLPGIGIDKSITYTNKAEMRGLCAALDFPNPKFEVVKDTEHAQKSLKRMRLPLIVKPIASHSSKGVVKVSQPQEISKAFDLAKNESESGDVLIEEFIDGEEFTIEGLKLNSGGHYSLAISYKKHFKDNSMVASQLWYDESRHDLNLDSLVAQHNKLIESTELPFGITHAEYRYKDGEFFLIEVAARGGGTKISSHIVPIVTKLDINLMLLKMALGEKITDLKVAQVKQKVLLHFFQFRKGKVSKILNLPLAQKLPGVVEINLIVGEGQETPTINDDSLRHGYAIIQGPTINSLEMTLNEIQNLLKVEYENNTNI